MIIRTKRSTSRYLLDILLTSLGWSVFCYLFVAGILAILSEDKQASQVTLLSPLLLSSTHTVINYLVVALLNANLLIGWAVYNQFRFAGKKRRKPVEPLSEQKLHASFALSPGQFKSVQGSSVMVLYHEENNRICAIDSLKSSPARAKEMAT